MEARPAAILLNVVCDYRLVGKGRSTASTHILSHLNILHGLVKTIRESVTGHQAEAVGGGMKLHDGNQCAGHHAADPVSYGVQRLLQRVLLGNQLMDVLLRFQQRKFNVTHSAMLC